PLRADRRQRPADRHGGPSVHRAQDRLLVRGGHPDRVLRPRGRRPAVPRRPPRDHPDRRQEHRQDVGGGMRDELMRAAGLAGAVVVYTQPAVSVAAPLEFRKVIDPGRAPYVVQVDSTPGVAQPGNGAVSPSFGVRLQPGKYDVTVWPDAGDYTPSGQIPPA